MAYCCPLSIVVYGIANERSVRKSRQKERRETFGLVSNKIMFKVGWEGKDGGGGEGEGRVVQ